MADSNTGTVLAIAAGAVAGLYLLSRISVSSSGAATGPATGPQEYVVLPPGSVLPPINAINIGYDAGDIIAWLDRLPFQIVDGLVARLGWGRLVLNAGVVYWIYNRKVIGVFIKQGASWTFRQISNLIRGRGGGTPPTGGAPATGPSSSPHPSTGTSPSVHPATAIHQSVVQATIDRIKQALEKGTVPLSRDVQNLVHWIRSGVVSKAAVIAALGGTALVVLARLAPAVSSLAPLAAAVL